jgi:large subunit ribosomal protein L25
LEINRKEFEKVYREAGESSLISLSLEGKKEEFLVLIHEIQLDPVTGKPIHIDFYQPRLKEETEAKIHLVFEGESG